MLKRTFETEEIEAKFWVNKETGNMHIDINGSIGEIPHDEAFQIILELKQELLGFQESKSNLWNKLFGS